MPDTTRGISSEGIWFSSARRWAEETQPSGRALRSSRRGSARGREPGAQSGPMSELSPWSRLRIGRSGPASLRTVGGLRQERPGIGAPAAPGSRGRVRGLASAAGGRSRAVSRRSCWRRRRRRRLAVGRGRGLRDSEVAGGSGVSGFFIPRLEGGPPEGCRPGRAEERLGRADRPPPGRGGKGRTRSRGAAAVLINRSPGAQRGRGGGARTPLSDSPHRDGDPS